MPKTPSGQVSQIETNLSGPSQGTRTDCPVCVLFVFSGSHSGYGKQPARTASHPFHPLKSAATLEALMNYPADLKYTKNDEWIRADGKSAAMGVSDFAQHQLSDVVFVEVTASLVDHIE